MNATLRALGVAAVGVCTWTLHAQPHNRCGEGGGAARGIRFVVAEPPGTVSNNDSYTLVLVRPDDIAHARRLIAEGPDAGNAIVYARVAIGADSINRDWRAAGAPAWSWHIEEFFHFTGVTAEILDYWPAGIELDPQGWVEGATMGEIGFWSYTVVQELPPACPADFNCDSTVTSADFFAFLAAFFAEASDADYTADGRVDSQDFFAYLAAFFSGCS